jgi:hypothetical protein
MAKAKEIPVAPALRPEKSIPILENLISQSDAMLKETSDGPRQQWAHNAKGALLAALGNGHPTFEAFGTAEAYGFYLSGMTDAMIREQGDDRLRQMVAVLKSAVDQLRWQLPDPQQVFLPAGSTHDAYVEIRKIVQSVKSEIVIVDSYVDGTLWTLLTNLSASAKIRIMTMQMKGDFRLEGQKFVLQHGNTIEVRQTRQYHDRFVISDVGRIWQLGVSIKDAGNKAFAISEILSPAIRAAIRSDVETTWKAASVIPL